MNAWLGMVALLAVGCVGDTVIDAGAGGATGTSNSNAAATGTSSNATTATGGPQCDMLYGEFRKAFGEAVSCNFCVDMNECRGGPIITDECGCPAGANNGKPDAAKAAAAAYRAWVDDGCGPYACGKDCYTGNAWTCSPVKNAMCTQGTCVPSG